MTTRTSAEEIARKQLDAWNRHDADAVADAYTSDARIADPTYPEPLAGRETFRKDAADFFVAFPDLVFQITRALGEGDTVALEGTAAATHTGPLQLPTGLVPATGKRLQFTWAVFMEINADGKVRAERRYYDVATQMDQLGLMQ